MTKKDKRNSKLLASMLAIIFAMSLFMSCILPDDESDKNSVVGTAVIYIACNTILDNLDKLDKALLDYVPSNGVILDFVALEIFEDETPISLLRRVAELNNIPLDASSVYVAGINHLRERSVFAGSGWVVYVNGSYLTVGASKYTLKDGDVVQWHYTCVLGDVVVKDYSLP